MRVSISTVLPALLKFASARIYGLAAPSQVAIGSQFQVKLLTQNYIQRVEDVSVAFGFAPEIHPESLGLYASSSYLGPEKSNIITNVTVDVTVPDSLPKGETHLTAGVTSLYGVSSQPTTTIYSVPVNIADETSSDEVSDISGTSSCPSTSSRKSRRAASAPPTLESLIHDAEANLTTLRAALVNSDDDAAQIAYQALQLPLNRIFSLANPSGNCDVGDTFPSGGLSRDEAIALVGDLQDGLNVVLGAELDGDDVARAKAACLVDDGFFHAGLHEFLFPHPSRVGAKARRDTPAAAPTLEILIPAAQTNLTNLHDALVGEDQVAAQEMYQALSLPLNRIFFLANPSGDCHYQLPPPSGQIDRAKAIELVGNVQDRLNDVLEAEQNGDEDVEGKAVCVVDDFFFHRGVREFVFMPSSGGFK